MNGHGQQHESLIVHFELAAVKKHNSYSITTIFLHAPLLVEDLVQRVRTEFRHPFSLQFDEVRKSKSPIKRLNILFHLCLYIALRPASAAKEKIAKQ